jgi:hypothetical protein
MNIMFSKTKTPSELTNSNMLERITLLENNMQQLIQNNQFLIQKVTYLENALNESHQKLERRITDYTDVWHPMMTANIVRVKEELVDTVNATVKSGLYNVIESEVKSIVKSIVQTETQTIIDNLQTLQTKFDDTNIEGHTIIGYNDRVPAFIHIGYKLYLGDYNHNGDLGLQLLCISRQINTNKIIMTLKSIKQLHNIFNFTTCDLNYIYDFMFFDDNRNDKSLRATDRCECKKFYIENRWYNKTNAQYLLSILDELKIKILYNGSESYNQMPLRRYIL